jgi:hypothetical protein
MRGDGTVAGIVVEVIGVVHLGCLVDQSRLQWRRGLVPLRRAGAVACGGEKGAASQNVTRRISVGLRISASPSPPAMAGSEDAVEVGARTSRVEEDYETRTGLGCGAEGRRRRRSADEEEAIKAPAAPS